MPRPCAHHHCGLRTECAYFPLLGIAAQQGNELFPRAKGVGKGFPIEHSEKGGERFIQDPGQCAGRGNGTGIGRGVKAFDQREVFLRLSD